jgi:hypothetical protein
VFVSELHEQPVYKSKKYEQEATRNLNPCNCEPISRDSDPLRFSYVTGADSKAIQEKLNQGVYVVDNLEQLLNSRDHNEVLDFVLQNPDKFRTQ